MASNLWERHQLSEKLNGAKSTKGVTGEEEEWTYGPVRSAAATCGRRRFCLTGFCRSGVLRKTKVEEDERGLAWLCVVWVRLRE